MELILFLFSSSNTTKNPCGPQHSTNVQRKCRPSWCSVSVFNGGELSRVRNNGALLCIRKEQLRVHMSTDDWAQPGPRQLRGTAMQLDLLIGRACRPPAPLECGHVDISHKLVLLIILVF